MTLERAPIVPLPVPIGLKKTSAAPSNNPKTQMQATSKPVKVPEIVVKDLEERGYTVDDSSSATRIPVPIHDTPRSVDVVTRQVLDDQKVIRFSDALRNVSGTSQSSTQGGKRRHVYDSRVRLRAERI